MSAKGYSKAEALDNIKGKNKSIRCKRLYRAIYVEMLRVIHPLVQNTDNEDPAVVLNDVENHMPPNVISAKAGKDFIERFTGCVWVCCNLIK